MFISSCFGLVCQALPWLQKPSWSKEDSSLIWLGTPCAVLWQAGGVAEWRSVSLIAELLSGVPSSEEPLEGTTAEPFLGDVRVEPSLGARQELSLKFWLF